ncbi:peptidylprolyl isomerase [Altererythrobacter salegens]|uniref:peptidylprolyl isomerase n=1 Tax=Croceibacterium salegens TaxID=1737568 RepID=A0A6I4SRX1_9SPHN|nr:peptidylprolyl isomerase [Croceibacterium salegens]MXO58664.1 peptidylprolyl isomerase [Croceibacterium salegens]
MLKRFAITAGLVLSAPLAAQDAPKTDTVVLETSLGEITLAIESERAPVTAANFLRYVAEKRFDGTVFYRSMKLNFGEQPNGLVQGGTQMNPDRIRDPVAHEPTSQTGIKHVPGTISMARYAPGTATGDFSIMLSAMPSLDADPNGTTEDAKAGFAAFGHVTAGMDVVRKIFDAPTDPNKGEGFMKGQMIADPPVIISARCTTCAGD